MFKLFINQDSPDPSQALVAGVSSSARVTGPIFTRGGAPTIELHFLRTNPAAAFQGPSLNPQPFLYDDPAAWDAVSIQIGTIDAPPDSGSFTLTDPAAGQTTGPIAFGATTSTVQAAIRSTLTTNYATAVVTLEPGISYAIDRGATGAIVPLTGDGTGLSPTGSAVFIERAQSGDGSHHAAFEITLLRAAPALRNSGWSALPALVTNAAVQTAGSGTVNKTFRVTWSPDAYAGAIFLTFVGTATTAVVGPIAFNASAADVATAFGRHADVASPAGVAVVQNGPGDYSITCLSTATHLSNTPTLAVASNTLQVPVGVTAALDLATAGMSELLGTLASVVTNLEVKKTVGGSITTVLQLNSVTVRKDLIRNQGNSLAVDPTPPRQFLFAPLVTGYIGGGTSKLDGLPTVGQSLNVVSFVHPTDGIRFYQLVAGTDAESSPGVIRPDDFDAGTNAKVWKLEPTGTSGIADAPSDGTIYARKNAGWVNTGGAFLTVDSESARLLLGGSNPTYGSTVLQRDTLHVYLLIDPAHCDRASSWIDIGMPAPVVIFSQTDGMTTGTTYSSFSGSFTGAGVLMYATGDGIWHTTPPAIDSSGVFQVGAILVENLTALALPAGTPLTGTLLVGDASMGGLPPVAPNLASLLIEGCNVSTVNLWNLVHLTNATLSGCSMLAAVTFTNNNRISSLSADGCALSQSTVDGILAALGIEAGSPTVSGGTVNLGGGSSSAPSSTTDTTRLLSQSWTVVTN